MKVWVLGSGQYSDFSVDGVYTSAEAAKAAAQARAATSISWSGPYDDERLSPGYVGISSRALSGTRTYVARERWSIQGFELDGDALPEVVYDEDAD